MTLRFASVASPNRIPKNRCMLRKEDYSCAEDDFLKLRCLPAAAQLAAQAPPQPARDSRRAARAVRRTRSQPVIERRQSGKPHQGKVVAAIQPHCDDIPIFAGGTLLKMIDEGYTGLSDHDVGRLDGRQRVDLRRDRAQEREATRSRSASGWDAKIRSS